MNFQQLIPNVYYPDISHGLSMFVDCLGFVIGHNEIEADQPFCVLNRDGLSIYLFGHKELAKEHNPEFMFLTKDIDAAFKKISTSHPEFLHPNLNQVQLRPWGAREFAIRDNQVCIIFQQW
jgi:hypothetical protein